jgi:hypothetical protein
MTPSVGVLFLPPFKTRVFISLNSPARNEFYTATSKLPKKSIKKVPQIFWHWKFFRVTPTQNAAFFMGYSRTNF